MTTLMYKSLFNYKGVKLRMADANEEFLHLADAIGCGVASMPDAKGLFKCVTFECVHLSLFLHDSRDFDKSQIIFFTHVIFSESHDHYMGTYWADISSPHVGSVVENSDLMIFAGAILNDYTTVGWTALINPKTSIEMFPFKVIVCGKLYMKVALADLLRALAAKAPKKEVNHRFRYVCFFQSQQC